MNISYLKYIFNKYKVFYFLLFLVYFSTFTVLMAFVSDDNIIVLKKVIYFPSTIIMIAAYVIPLYDYRIYYQRSSANLYLSLPDKRVNLYRTSTYFHIALNALAFLISVSLGIMILAIKGTDLAYEYLFYYTISMVVIFISTYLFSAFIATRAYNITDAIIINLAYIALPIMVLFMLYSAFNIKNIEMSWYNISFIGACQKVSKIFPQFAIMPLAKHFDEWYVMLIMLILGLVLHYFSCRAVTKFKTEKIGDITNSFFGYRTLIPAFCMIILIIANYQTGVTAILVVIIMVLCYFVFSLIGKKNFKFNWKLLLCFLGMILLANLIILLFQ